MTRPVTIDPAFSDDVDRWLERDPDRGPRIARLIEWSIRAPKQGPGRPKRLAHVPGAWSRRITRKHRLIYVVHDDGSLRFVRCWGHDAPMEVLRAVTRDEEE